MVSGLGSADSWARRLLTLALLFNRVRAGHIFSLVLGIPHVLIDNKIGKLSELDLGFRPLPAFFPQLALARPSLLPS